MTYEHKKPGYPPLQEGEMPEWWPNFEGLLRATGNIGAACQAAGISRQRAYAVRRTYPWVRDAWDDAAAFAADMLELEARKRALGGSDMLLKFLLQSLRPDKYSDRVSVAFVRDRAERLAINDPELDVDEIMRIAEEIVHGE